MEANRREADYCRLCEEQEELARAAEAKAREATSNLDLIRAAAGAELERFKAEASTASSICGSSSQNLLNSGRCC